MITKRTRPLLLAPWLLSACNPLTLSEPGLVVPRTVAEDPALPAIDLNGTRLHVQTFGNAQRPVIVFLHGGPGSGDHRSMLRLRERVNGAALDDDHFLVFWDQRGAGLSRRHPRREITIETYLADLRALVDRYSPTRPVLFVGHSWGAMYATAFINRYPDRVAGAVLMDAGPLNGALFESVQGDLADLSFRREAVNDITWSQSMLSPTDHARMDLWLTVGDRVNQPRHNQRFAPDPEPYWRFGYVAYRALDDDARDASGRYVFDFTSALSRFRRPVLFLAGARSEILGPTLQVRQASLYPSAEIEVIAGGGHDFAWTHSTETVTAIRRYLGRVTGGAR